MNQISKNEKLLTGKRLSKKLQNLFNILRATAIGGVFFLLPLIVIGMLLAQFAQFCVATAKGIAPYLPIHSIGGYGLLLAIGFVSILVICFVAGMVAQRSIAKQFVSVIEKYLQMAFPRYSIVKEQISGNLAGELGGNAIQPTLIPILVRSSEDVFQLALEVDRKQPGWVTVYFPGSPDPWNGRLAIVAESKITLANIDFGTAISIFEKLGRDLHEVFDLEKLVAKTANLP